MQGLCHLMERFQSHRIYHRTWTSAAYWRDGSPAARPLASPERTPSSGDGHGLRPALAGVELRRHHYLAEPEALRHIAWIYRSPRLCKAEVPSILKGGDYVKSTISTPMPFAVTATGIFSVLANCP